LQLTIPATLSFRLKRAWRGTARRTERDSAASAKLFVMLIILYLNQRVLLDMLEQDEYMLQHLLIRTGNSAQAASASLGQPARGIRT